MRKWKVLFLIFVLFDVGTWITYLSAGKFDLAELPVRLVITALLVPIYGYAHQIPIGSLRPWQILFGLGLLAYAFSNFLLVSSLIQFQAEEESPFIILYIFTAALNIIFAIFFLYPSFMYAFKCQHLWDETQSTI